MNGDVKKQVARPIGQIPSGCFVMTASHGGRATGILASWVQQASFDPPMVTVAVKQGRPIQELIEASGHFVLNHVNENPLSMFRHFGRGFRLDEPAFDGLSTQTDPAGIILQDCAGHLSCRVVNSVETGDHRLYIGEVIGGSYKGDERPYVHLRSNGLQY
ncbi:MAG TPA: flavin reductase family protein [Phycisphaerae bacterium]|nr:flavin reductase family protein [Phycisphaerae bacterium]HOJ75791.1 flavin reductase family protein [Phycisphaerae bacterium]HOM53177.1 flavin reductase family protein [Phycisphaerae bacterium]HOQ87459.1 flavin reductase family protein [Phycisphaerae bacterium]HPP28302.1 flavin reductase family protein [Phycisphaerae bacterium]